MVRGTVEFQTEAKFAALRGAADRGQLREAAGAGAESRLSARQQREHQS